jgi:hypothetical protein
MNLMRLSFEERHTRYIVQSNEQEIRGISRKTSEIWGTLDSVTGLDLEWLTLLGLPTAQEDSVLSACYERLNGRRRPSCVVHRHHSRVESPRGNPGGDLWQHSGDGIHRDY